MKITIQTFSGRVDADGQPELLEEHEIAFDDAQVAAIKASALATTEADIARVVEGLVEVLIAKGLIAEQDLPAFVRDTLARRKSIRSAP
jgi:hypothetical protein